MGHGARVDVVVSEQEAAEYFCDSPLALLSPCSILLACEAQLRVHFHFDYYIHLSLVLICGSCHVLLFLRLPCLTSTSAAQVELLNHQAFTKLHYVLTANFHTMCKNTRTSKLIIID